MWKMVLWGATYNAVVVVGVVSLLLFRLPQGLTVNRAIVLKAKARLALLVTRHIDG